MRECVCACVLARVCVCVVCERGVPVRGVCACARVCMYVCMNVWCVCVCPFTI